jgi:transcription elongation factor GreB
VDAAMAIFPSSGYVHDMATNYITPEGFQRLQEEFRQLFHEERPKLVETVAWAAGNGDRSENGDYIYGKRRLREIDRRLKFLRDRIENAQVVDPSTVQSDKVVFGATVTIEYEDGKKKTLQIVGEDEIDPAKNRISWKSPMAKALLGKKVGDEVEVRLPAGEIYAEIRELVYLPR